MKSHKNIVTVENGTVVGGLGSLIAEFAQLNGYDINLKILGVPDRFIEHGTPEELFAQCGFDSDGICHSIKELLK
jgi:1-deoxy-D-xylulose-5-phosphate synthase